MRAYHHRCQRSRLLPVIFTALCYFLAAAGAAAQVGTATIEGRVTDGTDAVLPGVTVTISSPSLQLPQMVNVTDGDGRFAFVDIPIGIYRVQYSLTGFSTVVREEIRLNSGFVARLDTVMKVGAIEESVTVSGQSPVVDVATTAGITNFTKEVLETVPNTRSMWQVLAMAPGVRPAGTPDVGGSQLGIQQGYKNYGTTGQVTPQLEGINTRQASTTAGFFYDYAALEEAQVKAVGNDAEVALPGTNWVAIVKSGGNNFHGQYFFAGEHSSMQSTNLDDELRADGVTSGNALRYVTDSGGDLGGRIIRDRLWFYGALRDQRRQSEVLNYAQAPGPDGKYGTLDDVAGYQDLVLTNQTIKGTYQAASKYRVIGFFQRNLKDEPQSDASRTLPFEATYDYDFPTKATKGELQATPTNQLLLNFVGGRQWYDANRYPQAGTAVPGNPRRLDRLTGIETGPNPTQLRPRSRWQTTGTMTYLPDSFLGGNHTLKGGYQLYWEAVGTAWPLMPSGDYRLIYDGTPSRPAEMEAYNNPIVSPVNKETQYSAFVQDRWALGRLTLNLGLRFDEYHAFVDEQVKEQGTFGNSGTFPYVDVLTWRSVVPRLGAAWDLTNDAKTVLKATYGLFSHVMTEDFAQSYNQNARTTYRYLWSDPDGNNDYTPGEINLALNSNPEFVGVAGATNNIINSDLHQPVTHEVSLGLERELMAGFSAKLLYVYKRQNNLYETENILRPYSAWNIPLARTDPGPDGLTGTTDDGGPVTVWTYPTSYAGAAFVGNSPLNSPNDHDDWYNTIEVTLNKRMSSNWDMLASFGATRNHRWISAIPGNPNDDYFPLDETWDRQFKLVGSYRFPRDIYVSTFYQYLDGDPLQRTFIFRSIPQASTVTLRLEEFGASREPGLNMLNLRAAKRFRFGSKTVNIDVDLFNTLNVNSATSVVSASGPTYGDINVIVPPRVLKLGATFAF